MDKINTVGDLKKFLANCPDDMPIMTKKYVQRWSGNPEDTDLSSYEPAPIQRILERTIFVPWNQNDPRRQDKRRTIMSDSFNCLVIEAEF